MVWRTWRKRLAFLLFALLALVLLIVFSGYLYLRQSLPQLEGQFRIDGLAEPVEIVRDRYAVPHIYAQSWNDAHFALGFVHAQDRLWQMEMNRRIASGRLAEFLGDSALDADKLFRTLGIRQSAHASLRHFNDETRGTLASYAAGVNAFQKQRRSPLPPEFLIFGIEPEPWEAVDSVAWSKMMAWDLGGNWRTELLRLRLSQRLTPLQISEFLPPYPGDAAVVLPDLSKIYAELADSAQKLAEVIPGADETVVGSNNWVVAGHRSETRKPILANDPHLGLTTPAIWYFAHLSVRGENVIGATLPGTPIVVLGRNDRIAWGFTNTGPDVQDLFIERLDPKDSNRYLAPDGYRNFLVRREAIRVKGKPDVSIAIRESRHGPIVSDVVTAAAKVAPAGHVLAFNWTTLREDDITSQGAGMLERAKNWSEFLSAARDYHSPQQNMVYADIEGNIGFIAPGRVPIRKRENLLQGQAPAPGWDAVYDWQGFIPFDELPKSFNPASGVVVTANQKIVANDYPYFISRDWAPPHRADRIEYLLGLHGKHSVESFRRMQADVTSLAMQDMLPMLLAVPAENDETRKIHSQLSAWNGEMSAERPEPLIAAAWLRELTRLVYSDELGPELFTDSWDQRVVFMRNVLQDTSGQSRWCDDITTPQRETCADLIKRALVLAVADLKRRFGEDSTQWRWGNAHPAISDHRPLARAPYIGDLLGIRVNTPGDNYTINVGSFRINNDVTPFANRHAAGLRAIYDLADLDRSVYMHSTGQSGNIFSPYYANFAIPWSRVESIPMTTSREEIEVGAIGVLSLMPAAAR